MNGGRFAIDRGVCFALFFLIAMPVLADPFFGETEARIKVHRTKVDLEILHTTLDADWTDTEKVAGEFRTPGQGNSYTLESLAKIAGDVLQTTYSGFVLRDRLVIAPNDELRIKDQTVYVADRIAKGTLERAPRLVVHGRLTAENLVMRSVLSSADRPTGEGQPSPGGGIFLSGRNHSGAAEVKLTNCSIQDLSSGLAVFHRAKATVTQSRFISCSYAVSVTSNSQAIFDNCSFKSGGSYAFNNIIAYNSRIQLLDSGFSACGALLWNAAGDSFVKGCHLDGLRDNGFFALRGLGVNECNNLDVSGNRIRNYTYGLFSYNSAPNIEDNFFECNPSSALMFAWGDHSRVRGNVLRYNATEINRLPPEGTVYFTPSAVVIYGGAQPDLGTEADPGRNQFLDNGVRTFYHATDSTITVPAQGNYWGPGVTQADVEAMIYHQPDDANDDDKSGFLSGVVRCLPMLDESTGISTKQWGSYR